MPLKVKDGIGAWIDDFKKSDAPQFKGKSDKERRDQAIAAYLSAKRGGETQKENGDLSYEGPKKIPASIVKKLKSLNLKVDQDDDDDDMKEASDHHKVEIDHMGGRDSVAKRHGVTITKAKGSNPYAHHASGPKAGLQKYLKHHYDGDHEEAKANHPEVYKEEIERRADFEITRKAMPDGSTKFVKKPRKAIEIGKGKMEANQKQDGPPWDGPSKTVKGPTDFHAMRAKVKSLAVKGMNQAGKKPGVKKNG